MEYVVAFIGMRGGGKSLGLARLGLAGMAEKMEVYSNMPIFGDWAEGRFESQPLDTNSFFSFSEKMRRVLAILDEMNFYAEARESSSNKNKIMNWVAQQIRKKEMSIGYSVQCLEWVDKRWQWQTDVLVHCKDLYHSRWGKENGLGRGEQFVLRYFDMSGVVTGRSAREFGRAYRQEMLSGKPLWPHFKSYEISGMEEAFRRWDIKRETYQLGGQGGNEGRGWEGVDVSGIEANQAAPLHECVNGLLQQLQEHNVGQINAAAFQEKLYEGGVRANPRLIGKTLAEFGVRSRKTNQGRVYDLGPA